MPKTEMENRIFRLEGNVSAAADAIPESSARGRRVGSVTMSAKYFVFNI